MKVHWDAKYREPDPPPPETPQAAAARVAWRTCGVTEDLAGFVRRFGLADKSILDIGAGRGRYQDIVADYTAVDISSEAARYFHKPFYVGSATALPFGDSRFDAAWSLWVLEHVPNPEWALNEMRRVVKPGGLIYLAPAWDCNSWAATGAGARPYSELPLKLWPVKASLLVREFKPYRAFCRSAVRSVRFAQARLAGGPVRFRYRTLTPNYEHYWASDADAVSSLDRFEAYLWFTSRGDECVSCGSTLREMFARDRPLIIRVNKAGAR